MKLLIGKQYTQYIICNLMNQLLNPLSFQQYVPIPMAPLMPPPALHLQPPVTPHPDVQRHQVQSSLLIPPLNLLPTFKSQIGSFNLFLLTASYYLWYQGFLASVVGLWVHFGGQCWMLIKYFYHSKEIRAYLDAFYVSGELQWHFKTKFIKIRQSVLKL